MKLIHQSIAVVVASFAAIATPTVTSAITLDFDLEFATSNQNIWGHDNGNFTWGGNDGLFAVEWDESVGKNYSLLQNTGCAKKVWGVCIWPQIEQLDVGFNAFTEGTVGLQNTFNLNGGIVDALIPIDLFFEIPDAPVNTGEIFTIKSGFSFAENANFSTKGIDASYILDLIFDVATGVDVYPGDELDVGFDIDEKINLVTLGGDDFNLEIDEFFGGIDVSLPEVNTKGIKSLNSEENQLIASGKDEFIKAALDLDGLASLLFGLPPLEESQGLDLGIFGNLGFYYNLLDVEATTALSMLQNFSLTGTLPAILKLEDDTIINFNIGDDISLMMPENMGEFLEVEAFIDFNALFNNTTQLGIDFGIDVMAGEFCLELPFLGSPNVGPLFEESVGLYDTAFDIFDETFKLGGFNQEKVNFQIANIEPSLNVASTFGLLSAASVKPGENNFLSGNIMAKNADVSQEVRVPEPSATLGLFTLGILGAGSILKRRWR
ncbi:MAG: PEP-CTERM sorting domain-containing protein [Microcoleaceae cyanobacterium]